MVVCSRSLLSEILMLLALGLQTQGWGNHMQAVKTSLLSIDNNSYHI